MNKNRYKINRKTTLNDQVYKNLKQMIVDGEFQPGDKLNEEEIAKLMGVSSTPIREAFRNLSTEGIVEIIPYRGVFIREYDLSEIREVYECREVLENLAIDLAINNIAEEELIELKEDIINNSESTYDLSNRIHNTIFSSANNEMLIKLLDQLNYILLRDRNISAIDEERQLQITKEHIDIINALIKRDSENAKKAMSLHVKNGYLYIKNKLEV